MPADAPKLPPSHAAKARKLEAAFDAYLQELHVLKKERRSLKEKFIKRVDSGKIEDIMKLIKSL